MAIHPVSGQENAAAQVKRRLFTVDEYYRMAEASILHEDDRVELIEGEIVEMAPIGNRHAACVRRLNTFLNRLAGQTFLVSPQCPVRIDARTEPEPDIALLKPREDFYSGAHPGPADVLVAVEVSDTSLEYDSRIKLPLYASAGIPEAWLVNLRTETIEVHTRPTGSGYRETVRAKRGEAVASRTILDLELSVEDILG